MTETDSSPAPVPSANGPHPLVLAGMAAALAFAAFIPALQGKFVNWDDEFNFVNNPSYRGLGPAQLTYFFTDLYGHYMPVTWLTLGLDYVLYGMNPAGYHRTSLLWHAGCTFVFFLVALPLFRRALPEASERALRWSAFAATLFFAIHPLRAESVAWVTERRDVVCGLFFLLSVWAYLKLQDLQGGPRRMWLALSVLFFTLSLLSKAMGMTLPVVLLAIDLFPLRRIELRTLSWPRLRPLLVEKVPFFVLMIASIVLTGIVQRKATALYTAAMYPMTDVLLQPPYRIWFYVVKTVLPVALSPLYPFHPVHLSGYGKYLFAAAAFAAALMAIFLHHRRRPAILPAVIAYGALISPTVVWQAGPHFAADRYTYLACLPFALLFGGAMARWGPGRKAVAWVGGGILALLGALAWRQAEIWQDSESLWTHAINVGTPTEIPHMNRGVARAGRGLYDEALEDLKEALKLDPHEFMTWDNLSFVHRLRGELDEAVAAGTKAIEYNPKVTNPYVNRALAYVERAEFARAIADFTRAIEIDPRVKDGYLNRALAHQKAKNPDEAIADATRAIEQDPRSARAYAARGTYRTERRDLEGGLSDFARARELDATQPPPLVARGQLRAKAGDVEGAIADYSAAASGDAASPEAFVERGNLRTRRKELDAALADFARARELDPQQSPAHFARALARSKTGDLDGAIADYSEAIRQDGTLAAAYNNRGLARTDKGDLAGAIADYSEAIQREPRYVDAWFHRAGLRLRRNDFDGAIQDCDEALRIHARSHQAFVYRGSARANKGEFAGAIEDLQAALKHAPRDWSDRKQIEALLERVKRSR